MNANGLTGITWYKLSLKEHENCIVLQIVLSKSL